MKKIISLFVIFSFILSGNLCKAEDTLRVPIDSNEERLVKLLTSKAQLEKNLKDTKQKIVNIEVSDFLKLLENPGSGVFNNAIQELKTKKKKLCKDYRIQNALIEVLQNTDFEINDIIEREVPKDTFFYSEQSFKTVEAFVAALRDVYKLVITKDDSLKANFTLAVLRLNSDIYARNQNKRMFAYDAPEYVKTLISLLPDKDALRALLYIKKNMRPNKSLWPLQFAKQTVEYGNPPGSWVESYSVSIKEMIETALKSQEIKELMRDIDHGKKGTISSI